MRLALALAAGLAFSALGLTPALAQLTNSSSSTFPVNGQVVVTCTVATAPLNFPPYVPGGPPLLAPTTTEVFCATGPVPFEIEYDYGQNSAGCPFRNMLDPASGALLAYEIRDPLQPPPNVLGLRADVPNCVPQSGTYPFGLPPNSPFPLPVDGEIPPQIGLPPGNYSDAVTVTVWW